MKISLSEKKKLSRKYKIFLNKEEFEKEIDEYASKASGKIKIDGFRQGKAPLDKIKSAYMDKLIEPTINRIADKSIKKILDENNYSIATVPNIEVEEVDVQKGINFIVLMELTPEIPEIKYQKISVTEPKIQLTERELSDELNKIAQNSLFTLKENEDPSILSSDKDILNIDFVGKVDGLPFNGGSAKGYEIEIGSKTFIDNFEDQLIGKKPGDEVLVSVKFPDNYHKADLCGKQATFDVKINKIFSKIVPELSDEIVKKIGFETLSSLKEFILLEMDKDAKTSVKKVLKSRVFEKISDEYDFDLPNSILEKEIDRIKKTEDKSEKKDKMSEKEILKKAEKSLRLAYIIQDISSKNKVEVTKEDIRTRLEKDYQGAVDIEKILSIYNQNPQMKDYLSDLIMEEKIFDLMYKDLKIKEKEMNGAEFKAFFKKFSEDKDAII